jgi:hypothetical protein
MTSATTTTTATTTIIKFQVKDEIRRVPVAATTLPAIALKCKELFPLASCNTFMYVDGDGDKVTIASEEDMAEAIQQAKTRGVVLKLHPVARGTAAVRRSGASADESDVDLKGRSFVAALREYVRVRPLGREAQEIDRSLNRFAAMFSAQNADFPLSEETLYVLAFSTVMLNTDLHNAAVKHKMTREQFVRNTKAATQEPSVQFLGQIFEEIRQQSLQIGSAVSADFVMV